MHDRLIEDALSSQEYDPDVSMRDRLRVALAACKSNCDQLSGEIAHDLPNYTLHDHRHTDALLRLADLIAGPEIKLTPCEAFVFGCAVLFHDLAMAEGMRRLSSSSYKDTDQWKDLVHAHYLQEVGVAPAQEDIEGPPLVVAKLALAEFLRETHAEQALSLPFGVFRAGDSSIRLIPDDGLRNSFAQLIGQIAASHWWSEEELRNPFDRIIGPPADFPRDWTVDPLIVACLLRTADICHIDASRAPALLHAFRRIESSSDIHWQFQERINQPTLDGDRIAYTSNRSFGPDAAESWWLCRDTLESIDRCLRAVDSLLADANRKRLLAKSVAHVYDISALTRMIQVEGWFPVDARIHVSDLFKIVETLGGAELYGSNPMAAVREVVVNAADAIRARTIIDSSSADLSFRIQVAILNDGEHNYISIEDNGIGMSLELLSGAFLDFGKSYWSSRAARTEIPGLLSSGFSPTGKFGIGFFSVFMLGREVKVTTRRYDRGFDQTYVLEFQAGLRTRPIIRAAPKDEVIPLGGTRITVKVEESLLERLGFHSSDSLRTELAFNFPTLDVALDSKYLNEPLVRVIESSDWVDIPPANLLSRLEGVNEAPEFSDVPTDIEFSNLFEGDRVVGRLALNEMHALHSSGWRQRRMPGNVTIGGARSGTILWGISGFLMGEPLRAARDAAKAIVSSEELARWASDQAVMVTNKSLEPDVQISVAQTVCALNGRPGELIIARNSTGFLNTSAFIQWASSLNEVIVCDSSSVAVDIQRKFGMSENESYSNLTDSVVATESGWYNIFEMERSIGYFTDIQMHAPGSSLERYCVQLIADAWGVDSDSIRDAYERQIKEVQDFEASPEFDINDDSNYPYRLVVGKANDGADLIVNGHIFRRVEHL